jgi:hypothetical protein
MTRPEIAALLEERDARLGSVTRALSDLLAETERVLSPDPALSLAALNAKLVLEHEGVRDAPPPYGLVRDRLCLKSAWCTHGERHDGECTQAARPAVFDDFGPDAAKRRRY